MCLLGALCLVMASDPGRYRPLVRFLEAAVAVRGVVFPVVSLRVLVRRFTSLAESL